jgi:hypothetical protein
LAGYASARSLLLADENFSTHLDSRCASDRFRNSLSDQTRAHPCGAHSSL